MSEQQTCPNCDAEVPDGADVCPDCGLNPKRKLFVFSLVIVLVGGAAMWFKITGGTVIVLLGLGLGVASRLGPTVWA